MDECGEKRQVGSIGRRVETPDVIVGVTGRLARRLASLAVGIDAALAKIAKELPLAEPRLREVRMLAAAAKREAALLDQVAEIDDARPACLQRVEVVELTSGAAPVLKKLEERGVRVVLEPVRALLAVEGDPGPLGRMVRRFAAYAGEVLGPGGVFRISFDERMCPLPVMPSLDGALSCVRAAFSLEGFRPRPDDVDLDGGKLMTSIEADMRLAAAVASAERSGAHVRVERHGPRDATVCVFLPMAADESADGEGSAPADPLDPFAGRRSAAG